ncbi:NAD-dependent epimerase/dehydratase family protein [Rhizobium sp. C4]|uniref:NAD-dependent epimerase/dehydratase family protein n=1 Tax=Rhizobium sp. C4 TaxID=1349800 RepID=UPI001E34B425|nr:NAD-dependent epimerase/dehydratase family protein [Rhizobium sp. C4]MCD2174733.1 NAD-dependent epimerase/dehydratase family protein [Rhizobium sp. C4]
MKIAVLGANGRLAHAVAKAFLAHGHEVVAVTRSGRCDGLSGRVEYRAADAMDRAQVIAATMGVDMIFNGLNPPYDKWEGVVLPMAGNVMAAAKQNGAVHLFIGNVYNYGKEIGLAASEDTPFSATTDKARTRIDMEALFRQSTAEGVKTIILRAGDFYGTDKVGTWLDLMIATKIAKGSFSWPGPYDLPHAFAYLPDLADAFVRLAERADELPMFSQFNFEGHTLTGEDFVRAAERAAGKKLARKRVSWALLNVVGLFSPVVREVVKMNYLWFTPHSLSGRKLEAFLGKVESTPADEAIAQSLADHGFVAPPMARAA